MPDLMILVSIGFALLLSLAGMFRKCRERQKGGGRRDG